LPSKGIIRPHQSRLDFLFRISDIVLIILSLWAAMSLRGIPVDMSYGMAGLLGTLCFVFFAGVGNLYRSWRGTPLPQEIWRVLALWTGALSVMMIAAFATKTSHYYSRIVISTWFLLSPVLLSLWRIVIRCFFRALRRKGRNSRTVAIAGGGDLGKKVAQTIIDTPWLGFRIVGFFDDMKSKGKPVLAGDALDVKGDLDELVDWTVSGKIDEVYIALPMRAEARIREIVNKMADSSASVYIVPDLFVLNILNARLVNMGGIPIISVFESPFYGVAGWVKKLEDIVLGSLILLLTVVPMVLIAIGVKLTSPGPVIFKQRRYGLDGKDIVVWKFRTMTVCEDGSEIKQAKKSDHRITRFGAFLRGTSLDELPQFINVLQGRMSIVGPRPHAVAHNIYYRKLISGYMLRHKVKPGITGLAQINGWRGETDTVEKMEKRIESDLEYLRRWSLFLDLKIIVLTVVKGTWRVNAY